MYLGAEKIICAAIWFKELPLVRPDVLEPRGFAPYNVDKGIVFCGWRHPNCLYQMVAMTGKSSFEAGENIQGFLTNKNRFVDREEAMIIAKRENQLVVDPTHVSDSLFSEDIY